MKYTTLFFGLCTLLFVGAGCIDAQADNQSGDYKMLKETLQLEESTVKGAGIIDKAEEALKKEESAINQKAKQAIKRASPR